MGALGGHVECNLPSTSAGSSRSPSVLTEDEIPDGFLFSSNPVLQVQTAPKKPQRRARVRPVLRMHTDCINPSSDTRLDGKSADDTWIFPDLASLYSALTGND